MKSLQSNNNLDKNTKIKGILEFALLRNGFVRRYNGWEKPTSNQTLDSRFGKFKAWADSKKEQYND